MYKEVTSGKRGPSANVWLNVALTQTPIGPSSIRRLCLGSNISASSSRSMYTSAGKVCKEIERIHSIDMKSRRNVVKTVNKIRGMTENDVIVQADGIYNNNLFSSEGKNPFRPATKCSCVVAENVTLKNRLPCLKMLTNFALNMDFIPLRTASAMICLVAVLQQFQWRLPLEMRKKGPKTAFWI